ncbi:MAG: tetratricopeptide repeat protein [Sedimentisphaerales bacterium]|nr:tetratricopeptide repeat protein [Sedimentisphaerales bacterium]
MQTTRVGDAVHIAVQHYQAGRLDTAKQLCLEILQTRPNHARALHLLGAMAYQKGLYGQAIDLIRKAIKNNPNVPQFHNTLGATLRAVGELQEAVAAYERAISLDPGYGSAYMNMGNVFLSQNQFPLAVDKYRHALSLDPTCIEAYNRMAIALQYEGEHDAAIDICQQALSLKPDDAEAYNTMASVLMKKGYQNEAIENYRRALTLKPDYVEAHCNLGMILLLNGQFEEGWSEYRWRLQTHNNTCLQRYSIPCWDGSPFVGQKLVVHYEQGFGDNIQFIRYLPMVKSRGGTVICETLKPLSGLLRAFPGIDELIDAPINDNSLLEMCLHVPLLELPRIFGTTLHTIPCNIPYLHADPIKAKRWRERLTGKNFKVGIVWAGQSTHTEDRSRSCHLRDFLRLAKIPGVQLISLQKGVATREIEELAQKGPITNLSDKLNDFSDTAAVIENLDLIISVDTAVLHLSGAMGKPAWALLSSSPDWRWLLARHDSPWYPTIRLFRQRRYGDWKEVFNRITEELNLRIHSFK